MKNIMSVLTLCLIALCSCEQQPITTQGSARESGLGGGVKSGGQLLGPTIVEQTYVPTNSLWASTRCRAWRISWPTYPVGTNPDLIPTMFSVTTGTPYSFNFLNNTAATTTYKTDFNLYHANKLSQVYLMWPELDQVVGAGAKIENAQFQKSKFSAATIEGWVKGRPSLFESYWEESANPDLKIENYQQGDIYQFRLLNKNRYGGIRIVSMTPRIMEVYLAEPNL